MPQVRVLTNVLYDCSVCSRTFKQLITCLEHERQHNQVVCYCECERCAKDALQCDFAQSVNFDFLVPNSVRLRNNVLYKDVREQQCKAHTDNNIVRDYPLNRRCFVNTTSTVRRTLQ